jgi:hypothetical protein
MIGHLYKNLPIIYLARIIIAYIELEIAGMLVGLGGIGCKI